MRYEDKIRDYLAKNLELLEAGLELIQKEFSLPNSTGAGGRIDIVAKDRFGQIVVIEIKRSNQAARQALHEIQKYAALFLVNQGLDQRSIRLIVVSTEWHELLLPLAEFSEISPYSVEGFDITADCLGAVTEASKLDLVSGCTNSAPLKISRQHSIYFFKTSDLRDLFSRELVPFIKAAGLSDFSLLACDHKGGEEWGGYPYGLYLFFSSPLCGVSAEVLRQIKEAIDWDDYLDDPDENFLCAIEASRTCKADSFEIGYPEKLTNMLGKWAVSKVERFGRLASNQSILPDDELIKLAQAIEGGSQVYFGKMVSPQYEAGWNDFRDSIVPVVVGYPEWEKALPLLLDEIETTTPKAAVTAAVYGPANLLMSFYAYALTSSTSWYPNFEIIIEDAESRVVRVLHGVLVWDGKRCGKDFSTVVKSIFGDELTWLVATHLSETVEYESAVAKAHNLKAVIAEWSFLEGAESGPHEMRIKKGAIERATPEQWKYKSLPDFLAEHGDYLEKIRLFIEGNTSGLRENIMNAVIEEER